MRSDRLMMVSGLAVTVALAPWSAQAADIVQTLEETGQYSKLVAAIEQAGLAETLEGDGSYTVFAPTDAAFAALQQTGQGQPRQGQQQTGQGQQQGSGDVLQQVSDDQLKQILTHHVIEGQELTTKDLFGQQQTVQTLSGDQLQVDGTAATVILVPTGLSVARVGDEVFVRREVAAMAHPAVTISMGDRQGGARQGGQGRQQTGQQQAGQSGQPGQQMQQQSQDGQSGQQQAASSAGGQQDQDGPAMEEVREEYREAVRGSGQGSEQGSGQQTSGQSSEPIQAAGQTPEQLQDASQQGQQQQAAGQTPEQLRQQPSSQQGQSTQQQTGQQGQGEQRPMSEQQGLLRAAMVVEPDIQADNGVIHGIDQVLVPQKTEQELMSGQAKGGMQQRN